ncbi:MAG TPA: GNAT family N-acetyltransferase [Phototrophicaceae bacterium]|nr:GNAT family N-acetyltransferase [Phototrophicaceae bacterium]
MALTLRPFVAADYPALTALINATLLEDEPVTADELCYEDSARDPLLKFARWVAVWDGQVVGLTDHTQYPDLYNPDKLWVMVRVHSDYRRRGIGAALYETLLAGVRQHDPLAFQTQIREDQTEAVAFAQKRGFVEFTRRWKSYLEVAPFDTAPFAGLEARLAREGIIVKTLNELADDPERDTKLYELEWALDQDVPSAEPVVRMSFENFHKQYLSNPRFMPEGMFIALDGTAYVGLSSFFRAGERGLHVDMTGVLRAYRGREIATLLKVRGIQFAQANGYERITATNDPPNLPMLAINAKLGYVRLPAQLHLEKTFANDA